MQTKRNKKSYRRSIDKEFSKILNQKFVQEFNEKQNQKASKELNINKSILEYAKDYGKTVNPNANPNANPNYENVLNRNHETEPLVNLNGATSIELNFDFHDLPYAGLLYAARRFHLGHYKYGRFNWTKGNKAFAEERLKHMMAHAAKFAHYRMREDLEAVLCNAMMLADFNECGLLSKNPRYDFMFEGKKITETITTTKVHPGGALNQEL